MAEASTDGNRMQRAAEGATLQVLSRYAIIAICAIALPTGAWMGARIIGSLDKVIDRVDALTTDVAVMKNDIGYLKQAVRP